MAMPEVYTEKQLREMDFAPLAARFRGAVKEHQHCVYSHGTYVPEEMTKYWDHTMNQLEKELERRLKMLELLPNFLREILEIAAEGKFEESDSEHPISEGEKDLGEMSPWEKACLNQAYEMRRRFKESPVAEIAKRVSLDYKRIVIYTIFHMSTRERLPEAHCIQERKGWHLADDSIV